MGEVQGPRVGPRGRNLWFTVGYCGRRTRGLRADPGVIDPGSQGADPGVIDPGSQGADPGVIDPGS